MTDVDGEEKRRKVRKVSHPPEGEDQGSILTHVKWMQEESKKKNPDWKQVKGLMEVTCKERRSDISDKMMVQDIKQKYPFLFSITEIHNEFERITGVVARTSLIKNLRPFVSEILNFSFKDKLSQDFVKTVVAKKLEEAVTMETAEDIKLTAALYLMPSLFKKKQSTIMGTGEGCTEVNPAPFLFISNDNIFEAETFRIGCEPSTFPVHQQ